MSVDRQDVSIAALALTQTVAAFQGFLPPLVEVRRSHSNDPEAIQDVRIGEAASAALALGVGFTLTSLTGSMTPAVVSLLTAVGLIIVYESALRSQGVNHG